MKKQLTLDESVIRDTEDLLQYGTWVYDVSTKDVSWTPGIYKLLGYNEGLVKPSLDFFMSHVLEEYRANLMSILQAPADQREFDFTFDVRTYNDEIKTVSSKGKIIRDETGAMSGLVGILKDISEIRQFQVAQEKALRDLNRTNKELEEFAYVASHDLQEPLRKITMFTERLKAKYGTNLDQDGHVFMSRILVSTENMKVLIDNLLEFSRTSRSSRDFVVIDLNLILQEVIASLEIKIEESRAKIRVHELPTLEAIPTEMLQLFTNLLSNAIKFRASEQAPVITISSIAASADQVKQMQLDTKKRYHLISITDNGIGFEPAYEERIFQIFQRLHGKSEYPGSGIGLAICKKIADNHGGVIRAQGMPGKGSVFSVILPEKQ
ncbi:MAG TPA: ATP-binding protein [Chryseosolibacter sp.]|nr:ATP-binding protein [Chryseosolibacter sp.]